MRVEEEPRLESSPRWPVGEVTEVVVVVVVVVEEGEVVVKEGEVVVEEPKSSFLLPKELLEDKTSDMDTSGSPVSQSRIQIPIC